MHAISDHQLSYYISESLRHGSVAGTIGYVYFLHNNTQFKWPDHELLAIHGSESYGGYKKKLFLSVKLDCRTELLYAI